MRLETFADSMISLIPLLQISKNETSSAAFLLIRYCMVVIPVFCLFTSRTIVDNLYFLPFRFIWWKTAPKRGD